MEAYYVYSLITGAVLYRGEGPPGTAARQVLQEGTAILMVPPSLLSTPGIDMGLLRDHMKDQIDAEAGAIRKLFITDVPGQAQTYERKEAEARRWQDGDDLTDFPFMAAEAEASGKSVAEICSSILTAVATLTPIAARIEGKRMAAKRAMDEAADLLALVNAKVIDWQSVVTPPDPLSAAQGN